MIAFYHLWKMLSFDFSGRAEIPAV
jgi:hypothetical protein